MGLFDYLICKYPLPLTGANDLKFQTKDTPSQFMDKYMIEEDGTLWHEEYETEDHSPAALWEKEHPGEQAPDDLCRFVGSMSRVNRRWVRDTDFTGEISFYDYSDAGAWTEFSSYFVDGQLKFIHQISPKPQENAQSK